MRKLLGMRFAQNVADRLHAPAGPEAAVTEPDEPSGPVHAGGRAGTIYGGTTEVQLNIIGERLLRLPRDP